MALQTLFEDEDSYFLTMAPLMDFLPSQSAIPFLYEELCMTWSWIHVLSDYPEVQLTLGVELFTFMSKTM